MVRSKRDHLSWLVAVVCLWSVTASAVNAGAPLYQLQPLFVQADIAVDEMPPAMREAYIRGIQEELTDHGYDPGPADGIMGTRTTTAIRAYQRDADLPINGVASKGLLDHLKFVQPRVTRAAAPAGPPAALVTNVQLELARRGFYRGTIDGISGSRTLDAVRAFQSAAGLPVTGTLDERLLAELRSTDANIRARDL